MLDLFTPSPIPPSRLQDANHGSRPRGPIANCRLPEGSAAGQLKSLGRRDVAPFLSPYLMRGYREDVAALSACLVGEGLIVGRIDIDSHFTAGDGFHLTVPLTMVWVAQLAIIYGCIDAGLPEKRGEVYLRDFEIECRKPVRKVEAIELSLSLDARRRIPGHYLYKGRFAVEQDHFLGRASFILPVD